MKKILCSMVAFVIMSAIIFGGITPIATLAMETTYILDHAKSTAPSKTVTTSNVPISQRYHVIENGYRGKYDLQEGIFGYQGALMTNRNTVYFYSDGYFEDAPEIYNTSLSTMSMALALSAFNARRTNFDFSLPNGSYSNLFRHVKQLMSDIGINEQDIFVNDDYAQQPSLETIGMIMGAKEIVIDSEDYILVPIVVRGGDYESEWGNNFTIGKSGESYGFSNAATQLMEQIENYINSSTSFDIPSAIQNGNVKFWVMGYSRGGSVANIISKRLTDIYGAKENEIYSYSFEAPSGGIDGTEIKEDWTYNGVYANLHNIINSGDVVPRVPTKQMGFKRYGVDHYVPGTNAGEIVSSTYITPTGITVTTYADNTPYVVGDNDYNERRPQMLLQLAAIDNTLEFKDEFSVGKIDVGSALSGSGNFFTPIEVGKNITVDQYLDCFMSDLQFWAGNGLYSNNKLTNGGYNNDFREFYTSNSEFAGKEYVTLENALQYILDLVFTQYYNEEFAESILTRLLSLTEDYSTLFDLYLNVIQKWATLSKSKQNSYLNNVWDCLNGDMEYPDGTPVKKISDFVNQDEIDLLKNSVYSLSAFLFLFAYKDCKTSPSFENFTERQIHLITLAMNGLTIIQGHFPEICLAWLNTYDENYSLDCAKYANTEIYLINDKNNMPPEIESEIEVEEQQTTISLTSIIKSTKGVDSNSTNNGSAIYYSIYEDGEMVGTWELYRNPIILNTTNDTEYTIKAFAVRFYEKSAEIEITDTEIRTMLEIPAPPIIDDPQNNNQEGNQEGNQEDNQEKIPPVIDDEKNNPIAPIIIGAVVLVLGATSLLIFKQHKSKVKK